MKKNKLEQEKVAEILKKAKVDTSVTMCGETIITNKCTACGTELSSLERVIFFNKCNECAKKNAEKSREEFFKKYLLLAFLLGMMFMFDGYISKGSSKKDTFILIIQGIMVGATMMYISFVYIKKLYGYMKKKFKVLVALAVSVSVTVIAIGMVKVGNFIITIFFLTVLVLLIYNIYKDYSELKQQYNLLAVYTRKSIDEDYVNLITETVENKSSDNGNGDNETETEKIETKSCNFTEKNKNTEINKNLKTNNKTETDKAEGDNGGSWII